jgi:large subunit ribosomal protein L25
MEQLQLSADKRVVTGKEVRHLRKNGLIPAVVFGHAVESTAIQVAEKDLRAVLARGGSNRLISLEIEGQGQHTLALAREVQRHPLTAAILHVDFQAVVMTEKLRTSVGLAFVNQSPAVIDGSGMLIHNLDEVEIECLPADLISTIEVDLSGLQKIDDTIHVRDLTVSANVKILTAPEDMIVRVVHVTEIEAEEEAAEAPAAEVEVIRKGKVGEEEAE